MGEDIPRRLRRFRRKGQPIPQSGGEIDFGGAVQAKGLDKKQELKKQITMQLALDEVEKFKQRHKRLPKKKEYDKIAESIYKQLKDEKKRKRLLERHEKKLARKHGKKGEKKRPARGKQDKLKENAFAELKNAAQGMNTKEIEGMKVRDLFGGDKKGKKPAKGDEFSLEGLSDLDSGPEAEEKSGCPKCGNQTEDVIFCPECGTAFCEKCAKRVEKAAVGKTLTCPECGSKIKR